MNLLNLKHTNFLRTFSILTDCDYELVTDLRIVCHNGTLESYQFLFSRMSPMLRRMFSSKLVMEDGGKRKDEVTLHLPDVDLETLKRAVTIFTEGVVNVPNQEASHKLLSCWTLLSIEWPTLDSLEVISQTEDLLTSKEGPGEIVTTKEEIQCVDDDEVDTDQELRQTLVDDLTEEVNLEENVDDMNPQEGSKENNSKETEDDFCSDTVDVFLGRPTSQSVSSVDIGISSDDEEQSPGPTVIPDNSSIVKSIDLANNGEHNDTASNSKSTDETVVVAAISTPDETDTGRSGLLDVDMREEDCTDVQPKPQSKSEDEEWTPLSESKRKRTPKRCSERRIKAKLSSSYVKMKKIPINVPKELSENQNHVEPVPKSAVILSDKATKENIDIDTLKGVGLNSTKETAAHMSQPNNKNVTVEQVEVRKELACNQKAASAVENADTVVTNSKKKPPQPLSTKSLNSLPRIHLSRSSSNEERNQSSCTKFSPSSRAPDILPKTDVIKGATDVTEKLKNKISRSSQLKLSQAKPNVPDTASPPGKAQVILNQAGGNNGSVVHKVGLSTPKPKVRERERETPPFQTPKSSPKKGGISSVKKLSRLPVSVKKVVTLRKDEQSKPDAEHVSNKDDDVIEEAIVTNINGTKGRPASEIILPGYGEIQIKAEAESSSAENFSPLSSDELRSLLEIYDEADTERDMRKRKNDHSEQIKVQRKKVAFTCCICKAETDAENRQFSSDNNFFYLKNHISKCLYKKGKLYRFIDPGEGNRTVSGNPIDELGPKYRCNVSGCWLSSKQGQEGEICYKVYAVHVASQHGVLEEALEKEDYPEARDLLETFKTFNVNKKETSSYLLKFLDLEESAGSSAESPDGEGRSEKTKFQPSSNNSRGKTAANSTVKSSANKNKTSVITCDKPVEKEYSKFQLGVNGRHCCFLCSGNNGNKEGMNLNFKEIPALKEHYSKCFYQEGIFPNFISPGPGNTAADGFPIDDSGQTIGAMHRCLKKIIIPF